MWTRKSVKERGKKAFNLNYWKCVLVGLILSMIIGSAGSSFNGGSYSIPTFIERIQEADSGSSFHTEIRLYLALFFVVMILSVLITAVVLAFKYFLLTPFEYGCRKYFRKNLEEPAKLKNLVYVFDSHYKNVVKTAFLKDLFIWLWSLLFIIPGIIKSYQWRLVPYIMSENPTMNFREALDESTRLMQGNKWKSFVLDLSFIGWDILSLLTWGILGVFYVDPYKASTDAALYETLKYGIEAK